MTTTEQARDDAQQELPEGNLPAVLTVAGLPRPSELRDGWIGQVRQYVTEVRKERGAVHLQEDVFPLIRTLAAADDYLAGYARVIAAVRQELKGQVEDDAGAGVGYDDDALTAARWNGDGVPAANLVVPDADGDWHLTREWDTDLTADLQSLISVQARLTAAHACAGHVEGCPRVTGDPDEADDDCGLSWAALEELVYSVSQQAAEDTLERLTFLISPPRVKSTALKAWAKELSGKGLDDLASIVRTAWSSVRRYKGLKVERT